MAKATFNALCDGHLGLKCSLVPHSPRPSHQIPPHSPEIMSKLLRRPTRVECFYCSTQLDPRNPRNFRCYACGCWNRYDANGEIMSDEPAMHDEKMNMRSFAKRGEHALILSNIFVALREKLHLGKTAYQMTMDRLYSAGHVKRTRCL